MTKTTVESRAHRILKRIDRFVETTSNPDAAFVLESGERVLGAYQNSPGAGDVYFTTLSVKFGLRTEHTVRYADIASVDVGPGKADADHLLIHHRSGETLRLPVDGGHGKARDAFEVQRFLLRVVDDL